MINKYQRSPIIIEAIQYNNNLDEIVSWINNKAKITTNPTLIINSDGTYPINNLDYIIKLSNEFYPCNKNEFEKLYQKIQKPIK